MRISRCLLIIVLFISLTGCLSFKMDLKPSEELEEIFITGKENAKDKILIIPFHGIILGDDENLTRNSITPSKIKEVLDKADKDAQIKAIILDLDTPGGGVTASDMIHNSLKEWKKTKNNIPVIALMKDVAASGGYYISMASDYIVCHPTTITGSIGVISVYVSIEDLLKWAQVEVTVIKSGAMKDAGSPLRKMKPQEREAFQYIIDEMYNRFLGIVAEGRKSLLKPEEIKSLADGRVFTGKQALDNKLIDALGYQADAVNKAKEMAVITEAKVIQYRKPKGVFDTAFQIKASQPVDITSQLREILLQNNTSKFMYIWVPGAQ